MPDVRNAVYRSGFCSGLIDHWVFGCSWSLVVAKHLRGSPRGQM
jgi:hypothetical protein